MVMLRHKKNGNLATASKFNTSSLSEIIVHFDDEMDSDYQSNYDVILENGDLMDLQTAFRTHDIIRDNYNTRFFFPKNEDDKKRGFTLD